MSLVVGAGTSLIGLAALLPDSWALPAMAAAALGAIGGPMKDIPVAVLRQIHLPPEDRAAAMRAFIAATSAGAFVALMLTHGLLLWVGTVALTVQCGLVIASAGVFGLVRHRRWREPD